MTKSNKLYFQLDNREIVLTVYSFPRVFNTLKSYLTSGRFKNPIRTVSEHVSVSLHKSVCSAHGNNLTLLAASYEKPQNIFSVEFRLSECEI